jgi:hypothetical protein
MKRSLSIIALTVLSGAAAFSQRVDPATLKVNGVGLNSTYAQIVRAMGKPVKNGKATHEECIGGREKTVEYPGLSFSMMDGESPGGKTFEVKSFSVTSAQWLVSGVRVGDTQAAVKAKLGTRYRVDRRTDNGGLAWYYEFDGGEGTTTIIFKGGKVVEISTAFQLC